MSTATVSSHPRYKRGGQDRKCGFIWDNEGKKTYAQYLAEQMFILCRGLGRPEHYVSDIYWDMVWAQQHEQEYLHAKPGLLFVYVVRECGTNVYEDWETYLQCRSHHGSSPSVYRFEKQEDGTVRVREVEA